MPFSSAEVRASRRGRVIQSMVVSVRVPFIAYLPLRSEYEIGQKILWRSYFLEISEETSSAGRGTLDDCVEASGRRCGRSANNTVEKARPSFAAFLT